jgi:hypothetical protein
VWALRAPLCDPLASRPGIDPSGAVPAQMGPQVWASPSADGGRSWRRCEKSPCRGNASLVGSRRSPGEDVRVPLLGSLAGGGTEILFSAASRPVSVACSSLQRIPCIGCTRWYGGNRWQSCDGLQCAVALRTVAGASGQPPRDSPGQSDGAVSAARRGALKDGSIGRRRT